ncbi:hypothetical protein [Microbacterium gorillae]|uniref:hypothetical protein n=1 Tax=Microbacterium gorillae TaxID=1231063 RepID=UPI0006941DE7|nr:hypothetical protein [Microbacterium gorillae]
MTELTTSARPAHDLTPTHWHRPLVAIAIAAAVLGVISVIMAFVDPVQIVGTNGWLKPIKFSISTSVYAISFAWLIGRRRRWQRTAWWAGTLVTIGMVIELAIIVGAVALGTTSHFNVSTPLHIAMWSIMAGSIGMVWMMSLLVAFAVMRNPEQSRSRNWAIRGALVISLAGLAVAFLMTTPTSGQLSNFQGIAGAHAVGVADGGPGLPLLGWSTVGGDLRVPHFIGMHALQVLPLILMGLEVASRKIRVLQTERVRFRLTALAVIAFAALVAIVTAQALIGQSIVAPRGPIAIALVALAVVVFGGGTLILVREQSLTRVVPLRPRVPAVSR